MKVALIFPGQGSQTPGMGKELYEAEPQARTLYETANDILGFRITDVMFNGSDDDLRETKVTQPAVFLNSVIDALYSKRISPDMVAGHSLGEFSALVVSGAISFEDGLRLVAARASAMQKCCELTDGSMAAIIGLPDESVEAVCAGLGDVVAANYNTPGQVVISGEKGAVSRACDMFREKGARRALPLAVGGAFHSPLMEPARLELSEAIARTPFHVPVCPIYQNVDARPHSEPEEIKSNLLLQLTSSVRWTSTILNMLDDGCEEFVECGCGETLTNMIKRIRR